MSIFFTWFSDVMVIKRHFYPSVSCIKIFTYIWYLFIHLKEIKLIYITWKNHKLKPIYQAQESKRNTYTNCISDYIICIHCYYLNIQTNICSSLVSAYRCHVAFNILKSGIPNWFFLLLIILFFLSLEWKNNIYF